MIDFHKALSEETVHLRYFGFLKHETLISHERLVRICFSDYDREIVLVVEWIQAGQNDRRIVAVARLIKAHRTNEAELAIVISDDWQGRGLGTKLLRDLLEIGLTEGLERLVGHILPENYVMQRICRKLGFELRYDTSQDAFERRSSSEGTVDCCSRAAYFGDVGPDDWPLASLSALIASHDWKKAGISVNSQKAIAQTTKEEGARCSI